MNKYLVAFEVDGIKFSEIVDAKNEQDAAREAVATVNRAGMFSVTADNITGIIQLT